MTLRYKQTHERFARTEPRNQRFEVVAGDDPSVIVIPDVTLATDRPIRQYVWGLGVVRLRLRLQARKSLQEWTAKGRIQPDGTMPMLGDHGSGDFWSPNSARDNIGRWHNLRIENRGDGDDAHKALVADAHVHVDLAANWLGANFRPASVASVFRVGTIRDTSIGFEYNHNTLTLEDEERSIYRTDDWEPYEASFVWTGADNTGIGRHQDDDMSKEALEKLAQGMSALAAAQREQLQAITALMTRSDDSASEPEGEASSTGRADQGQWEKLAIMARGDFGEEAELMLIELEADEERCAKLASNIREYRGAKKPHPHFLSEGVGHEHHRDALADARTVMLARCEHTRALAADDLAHVPRSIHTAPLPVFLEMALRSSGAVDPGHTFRGGYDVIEAFRTLYPIPPDAYRSKEVGGRWLIQPNAARDHNGVIDIDAAIRAGTAVPADFPSLIVGTQTIIWDGTYETLRTDFDMWSRREDMDTLDEYDIVRSDVAVPSFDFVALPGENLPAAARWHDKLQFQTKPRGFTYSWADDLFLYMNGEFLTNMPAEFADAWAGEQSRYGVGKLINHDYAGTGAQFDQTLSIEAFLSHVYINAHAEEAVARPSTIDTALPSRTSAGQLVPDKLVYGPGMQTEISNFFKGRLNEGGRLPADTQTNGALTDWMVMVGQTREESKYIPATGPGSRMIYLFKAGGRFSSFIHGALRARQGARLTIFQDVNWRRRTENAMRVEQEFEMQVHQSNTLWRSDVP